MKLNRLEFLLMNNPVRAAIQRWVETPLLIGRGRPFAGQRVLEVGCGRGVGLQILLTLGAREAIGLDLDPRMVALARERLGRLDHRARVYLGDAEAIQEPDAVFDAVVDYGILHHVPAWRRALREIARVLRPGGAFYFEDLLRGFVAASMIRALLTHPQESQFTAEEFRQELEAAGMRATRWHAFGRWAIAGEARRS